MSYDIILIATPMVIAYILSYALYRRNILNKTLHTRIWNMIFLISFLLSAVMGYVLAGIRDIGINISISLDLNFWHVEAGIFFFVILFFHLQSNWSSFRKLLANMTSLDKK